VFYAFGDFVDCVAAEFAACVGYAAVCAFALAAVVYGYYADGGVGLCVWEV
jgi:hypothetical protein